MGIICAVVTIVQSTNDWMTVPGMLGYVEGRITPCNPASPLQHPLHTTPGYSNAEYLIQRLEAYRSFPTARIFSHWQGGVFELDVWKLWSSRVERTELKHVELKKTNL